MDKQLSYRVILQKEPEGGYTVLVPALQGCITYGNDIEHAKKMAKEAIEGYIEVLRDLKEPVPDDSNNFEFSLTLSA
jgi:antitoxin HicB